mmetsp:Transcript_15286/g.17737  ORF Transcript_15286/g.17737 Transcript_15286/m.17737 type:complete len:116 (+) Transcript_15286:23-370(+)
MESNIVIQQSFSIESNEAHGQNDSKMDLSKSTNVAMIWIVFKKASPLVFAGFGNAFKPTMTFAFVNMYSSDHKVFAAVGLGIMLMNIFLRSYITGFNNSMITQVSQAFGAGDFFK